MNIGDAVGEFVELVREMRAAQVLYFSVRTKEALNWSKALERRVDQWLQREGGDGQGRLEL